MLAFSPSDNMLCEWMDPILVRYALFILFVCASKSNVDNIAANHTIQPLLFSFLHTSSHTVVIVLTTIHLAATCGEPAAATDGWLTRIYITMMFLCTCALIVCSDVLVGRDFAQMSRIQRVLSEKFWNGDGHGGTNRPFWDHLQRSYDCCGVQNASDWRSPVLPDSCCMLSLQAIRLSGVTVVNGFGGYEDVYAFGYGGPDGVTSTVCTTGQAHRVGCIEALSTYARQVTKWLGVVAFAFACVAILGVFVSCASSISENGRGRERARNAVVIAVASAPPAQAAMRPMRPMESIA